jgi:hypothetical protein
LLFEPPNFHRGLGAAGRDEQEKENVCHRGFLSRIAASDSEWARGTRSRVPGAAGEGAPRLGPEHV